MLSTVPEFAIELLTWWVWKKMLKRIKMYQKKKYEQACVNDEDHLCVKYKRPLKTTAKALTNQFVDNRVRSARQSLLTMKNHERQVNHTFWNQSLHVGGGGRDFRQ